MFCWDDFDGLFLVVANDHVSCVVKSMVLILDSQFSIDFLTGAPERKEWARLESHCTTRDPSFIASSQDL